MLCNGYKNYMWLDIEVKKKKKKMGGIISKYIYEQIKDNKETTSFARFADFILWINVPFNNLSSNQNWKLYYYHYYFLLTHFYINS